MVNSDFPLLFLDDAASQIAHGVFGLTGSKLIEVMNHFAEKFARDIPLKAYPFNEVFSSKKKAFLASLRCFSDEELFFIISEMTEVGLYEERHQSEILRIREKLFSNFKFLGFTKKKSEYSQFSEFVIESLENFPKSLEMFTKAREKFFDEEHDRNCLDDLRLSVEFLLKEIFKNQKSLENQYSSIGEFIEQKSGSQELKNMFLKLIDYFSKYQNSRIKHENKVIDEEIEFVFELSSCFLKHLAKLAAK